MIYIIIFFNYCLYSYGIGLFTDGCIVIVEGCMNGDVFSVTQMGNPILVPRIESLELVQHIPILGLIPSSLV